MTSTSVTLTLSHVTLNAAILMAVSSALVQKVTSLTQMERSVRTSMNARQTNTAVLSHALTPKGALSAPVILDIDSRGQLVLMLMSVLRKVGFVNLWEHVRMYLEVFDASVHRVIRQTQVALHAWILMNVRIASCVSTVVPISWAAISANVLWVLLPISTGTNVLMRMNVNNLAFVAKRHVSTQLVDMTATAVQVLCSMGFLRSV